MLDHQESLTATLSKLSSLKDLQTTLPSSLTSKLGEGEEGVKRTMSLLIGLSLFAPNGTFDKSDFNAIVAFDNDSNKTFPLEEAEKMLLVALESGFITQEEDITGTRYKFDPQLHATMDNLLSSDF